ncbi:conserved hypothetical protein [Leishmania mexicana MHOM/GT/2001/U1103]|uniref:Uncharacterized protein n=1 Tax=Leishmania mexicana (strain MHOM/GT/2001/U1103) TaxID=929439 RepID=E9B0A6_LEIMU|nr:conserved hypothetical protein [Leishmania mexicana MHOM/GT/2001/U1103]CBZ28658.1 conserved hypothetical protein [Leishmania mexicana MHOM/GT/2001/U1103]
MASALSSSSSTPCSSACDCCECGVVVGTEGSQRGCLLLPCQHVLHMGCVEFIRRRGKVLMGMDSTDLPLGEEEGSCVSGGGADKIGLALSTRSSSTWASRTNDFCVCPACFTQIARIIPLYLRSANDDVGAVSTSTAPTPSQVTVGALATGEVEYRRVHTAQKQVLHRLRSLSDQRRRVTELTHACANLHDQRARCLAEVEREERCFPGLTHSGGLVDGEARVGSSSAVVSSTATALSMEHMGVTELELYMAQATPQLLRTQAELRKERQITERRTKRLNALRMHYHSMKELCALDETIAQREVHAGRNTADAARHSTPVPSETLRRAPSHTSKGAQRIQGPGASSSSGVASGPEAAAAPSRKRHRGDAAVDVDDEVSPDVVEVLSGDESDADDSGSPADVTVLDVDENTGSDAGDKDGSIGVDVAPMADDGTYADESAYEAPYLIPCYVRPATASSSSTVGPKVSTSAVTQHHLRLLPRREDRLWQPSLQF